MRKKQLSDADIRAVLEGRAPQGRADLEEIAGVVDSLRLSAFETPPRPSAGLAARLDADRVDWISHPAGGLPVDRTGAGARRAALPARGKDMFFSWFTGLGLVAKLAIGGAAFAAAATVGTVGAGAAGVLPPAVQTAYDDAVASTQTEAPAPVETDATDEASVVDETEGTDGTGGEEVIVPVEGDDESGPKTAHAQAVTEAAHAELEDGDKRGELVREAAHSNKTGDDADETDDSRSDSPGDLDDSDEDVSGDDDSADDDSDDSGSHDSDSDSSGPGSSNSGKGKGGN